MGFIFPHAETFFIGHIIIDYPILGSGNWILDCICAVLNYKHLRNHPYETMKWKFEESTVHILLIPIPSTVRLLTHQNNSDKSISDSCVIQ